MRARAAVAFAAVLALAGLRPLQAQHGAHGSQAPTRPDTLATAPTTPSMPVSDSGLIARELLRRCKPHVKHSIDAYSTCVGDGIAALSSAGNIALAMGTLDYVVHSDESLILLGHPLAHALG